MTLACADRDIATQTAKQKKPKKQRATQRAQGVAKRTSSRRRANRIKDLIMAYDKDLEECDARLNIYKTTKRLYDEQFKSLKQTFAFANSIAASMEETRETLDAQCEILTASMGKFSSRRVNESDTEDEGEEDEEEEEEKGDVIVDHDDTDDDDDTE